MCNFYIAPFHTKCSERFTQLLPRQACLYIPVPSQLPGKHTNVSGARWASTLNNLTRSVNCLKVLSHHSTVFSFTNKKSDIAHIEPMIIEE